MSQRIDLSDPRWFPVDLNVRERRFAFLELDAKVLEQSSFLDNRLEVPWGQATPLSADDVAGMTSVGSGPGWLFHTSFCASTLLARALHTPPHAVCLREPMVLRRLGDARHAGGAIDQVLPVTVALLSRVWAPNGRVVVKPTHAALNIATDLLEASPGSRAVILTSSLSDFLVSNLKKTPESQAKIPQLVERAMHASGFHSRLPGSAFEPPDMLCAAALQWGAQRELVMDVLYRAGTARARAVGMEQLLDDLPGVVLAVSTWLGLGVPVADVEARCLAEGSRHAKAIDKPYSSAQRHEEARFLGRSFADALANAHEWANANVIPYMRPEARSLRPEWALS